MSETERARRLTDDLDQRLQPQPNFSEQTLPEDRPLLQLAGRLVDQAPFAPTPAERSRLRRSFEQMVAAQKMPALLARLLKPTLSAVLWLGLLAGIFTISAVLIYHLLGQPVHPASGPIPTAPVDTPTAPSAEPSEPVITPTPPPVEVVFQKTSQTAGGIRMDLRNITTVGSSLRATLCYEPPSDDIWRLEGVELAVAEPAQALTFYPSSSGQPKIEPDGTRCETFVATQPRGSAPTGTWTITVRRLLVPRRSLPDCAQVTQQLAVEVPGLTITCNTMDRGYSFSLDKVPDGIDTNEAQRIVQTYFEYDVHSGPWVFTVKAGQVAAMIAAGAPISPVVVPAACDPDIRRLEVDQHGGPLNHHAHLSGTAGMGTAQSGHFSFLIGLVCDPDFSRLVTGGDYRSEINGLGILWKATYQGQTTNGEVKEFSGFEPFVQVSGGVGSMEKDSLVAEYQGIHFSEAILPDFTQSDVRLRYVVKIQTPDGKIEGAVLEFTLQRAIDGYRPVDITVEPLSEAERQTPGSDPNAPLPFPTLPAPVSSISAKTQALLDLIANWQKPILAAPGWVHLRTRTQMPGGNNLYAGLTEYTNDDWFQIDAQANAIAQIHIDRRLDGTILQQTISQNGKTINLTYGNTGEFTPFPLDLAYAVKDTLKAGDQVRRYETTVSGKPAVLLAINGMFTRRDAIDAADGAWLYTETVTLQPGDDPITGGSLDSRLTLEIAERVDAPPAEALALLGQPFTGYSPPTPYGTPAPQGFDPSGSPLVLHSVQGDHFDAPTFWYGDISTRDGYLLGRVDFGSIPGGFCDRSADGSKLAFVYTKVGKDGSLTSSSLRWFDLRSLNLIHRPAPELGSIGTLSWSPVQQKLAVFGCKAGQKDCGLYLLDPAADTVRLLLPNVYAVWPPIWSPANGENGGSQLAFVDTLRQDSTLYVVDIQKGQVTYQGKFNLDAWQAPPDSPTTAWGVSFPRGSTGSACFEQQ